MNSWITSTKNELLKAETENINSRLRRWQIIVNDCTKNEYISAFKSESTDLIDLPSFKPLITDNQMNQFLLLILNWNGINTRKSNPAKLPSTYKDYQLKAKNQINGSRAKHYSRTLYPFMIDCAESYANNISQMLFININVNKSVDNYEKDSCYRNISEQCSSLFYDILMYSYLVQLCQCRLRVTKQGRRVYLLCDNSIIGHKSNTTTKMFQKYATQHQYIDQFPSHREEAIDYFNKQKQNTYKQLFLLYQKRKTLLINNTMDNNNVITNGNNILNIMQFIKQHSITNDKKSVNIHKDTVNIILKLINKLQKQKNVNIEAIDDLKTYITNVENELTNQKHNDGIMNDGYTCNDNGCNEYNNINVFEYEKPTQSTCDGSIKSFNMSYNYTENINEFNNNISSNQSMCHAFDCDSVIMNSMPMCAPMSVDNQLVYNTDNQNKNDEYIHNTYDNFNDIQFNYDNLDIPSQYNII